MKKIWIDTETTGLNPTRHAIVQLAGIVEVDGEVKEEFDIRMRPFSGAHIDSRALECNGLTREQVMAYPEQHEGFRQFCAIMERHIDVFDREDKFTLAGYNPKFDEDFLRALFNMNGSKYFGSYFWFPSIDTAAFAHEYLCSIGRRQKMPNCKLGTVAEELGLSLPDNLHDALADIRLTRQVWLTVRERETTRIIKQYKAGLIHEGE